MFLVSKSQLIAFQLYLNDSELRRDESLINHFQLCLNFRYILLFHLSVDWYLIPTHFDFKDNLKVFKFEFRFNFVTNSFLHPIRFVIPQQFAIIVFLRLQALRSSLCFSPTHLKELFDRFNVAIKEFQSSYLAAISMLQVVFTHHSPLDFDRYPMTQCWFLVPGFGFKAQKLSNDGLILFIYKLLFLPKESQFDFRARNLLYLMKPIFNSRFQASRHILLCKLIVYFNLFVNYNVYPILSLVLSPLL